MCGKPASSLSKESMNLDEVSRPNPVYFHDTQKYAHFFVTPL